MQNEELRNFKKITNLQFAICNFPSPRPSPHWGEGKGERGGFTLIELLIVLFIIGIASGLVGILITQKTGNVELRTVTRDISTTLRYARTHAISEKKIYSFIIQNSNRKYELYTSIIVDEGDEESIPVVSKPIPEKLNVTFNRSEVDSLRIDFFPQGNSTGGVIMVNHKSTTFFIIVNRVTGKVEVKKSQNLK